MSEEEYITYFESIAEANKQIAACFTDPEQVFGRNNKYPCMLVLFPDSNLAGTNDNLLEQFQFQFWILAPAASQDFKAIDAARVQCKQIAKQVISKIKYDARNRGQLGSKSPVNIDLQSVRFRKDGPFTDGVYAIECTGNFIDPVNLVFNPDQWL